MNNKLLIIFGIFTVFLLGVLFWFLFLTKPPIKISSISPADGDQKTSVTSDIELVFSRTPTKNEESEINVSFSPEILYQIAWKDNALTITPREGLEEQKEYKIRVSFSNKTIGESSFKTGSNPASPAPNEDAIIQGRGDVFYAGAEEKFMTDHPWYSSLPKRTDDYFVSFDPIENAFFADLYVVDKSEEQIQKEVVDYLSSIGVPKDKFKIDWTAYQTRPSLVP